MNTKEQNKKVIDNYIGVEQALADLFGEHLEEPEFLLDETFKLSEDCLERGKFEYDEWEYVDDVLYEMRVDGYVAVLIENPYGRSPFHLVFDTANEVK